MTILMIASYAPSLLNLRGPLLAALVAQGHHVVACAPDEDLPTRAALAAMGVDFEPMPLSRAGLTPLGDLRYMFRLARMLRRRKPDAVLAYTLKPVVYGAIAARLAGVPAFHALITGLGQIFSGQTPRKRVLQSIVRALYRVSLAGARTVIFQNPDDQAEFRAGRLVGPSTRQALVNGSGVDLAHYASEPLPAGPPRFLMIARLLEEKGVLEYVAAARRLKTLHPEATFGLLGPLEVHGLPPEAIRAWEQEGVVTYMGATRDVRPAIASASVVVLPSCYREGVPRSILEAMAMGRPVITTDTPGCRETVREGDNGHLVPPRDVDALAGAMARMVQRPERLPAMGAASRAIAAARFDVHAVNAAMLEAMDLAPEREAAGACR